MPVVARPVEQEPARVDPSASPYRLAAESELQFRDGMCAAPQAYLHLGQGAAPPHRRTNMTGNLAGKRVLIVEDEYFIASDLQRTLQREEVEVVGPVGDLDRALSLAANERLDAAILDVNLEGATSYRLADHLTQRSIPYLFLTGYDGGTLPEPYRSAPRVPKPFSIRAVMAGIGQLLDAEEVS